jgi:hypothetical protein
MAAPRPALKYQLLPEPRELKPGNAAHNYLKCFMEQRRFFHGKEAVAARARYQVLPLAELPLDELRNYGSAALRQADWAARLDTVDWQDLLRGRDGRLEELPPEAGPLQVLAVALQVRFRAEIAGRQFDDAIRTAKTMFALARHLGEHPSEIANLVGLATAHLALNTLEELIQQPGCPNLFWALTDLPCPLVDLRKGSHAECQLVAAELRALRDDDAMTEADLEKFIGRHTAAMSFTREQAGWSLRNPRAGLRARAQDADGVRAARRRLVESGRSESLTERFPPLQVILLDEKHAYEIERDERLKFLTVPLWQILTSARDEGQGCGGVFADHLPHIVKLRQAQGQLEQQIAMLRHVEALRLYAASHNGQVPSRLYDMTVPLPADPVTGKPFAYSAAGATAQIHGRAPRGGTKDSPFLVHFEVTVVK